MSDAIHYAGQYADVISLSWYTSANDVITEAIRNVTRNKRKGLGCIVLACTGNEGSGDHSPSIKYPASLSETIAVGASTNEGKRANYSQYGPEIDFLAPSSGGTREIFTIDVTKFGIGYNYGQVGQPDEQGHYTNSFGGTSAATPLAAEITALILSANHSLTSEEFRKILCLSCDKIDMNYAQYDQEKYGLKGFSLTHGFGRVNAENALKLALKP